MLVKKLFRLASLGLLVTGMVCSSKDTSYGDSHSGSAFREVNFAHERVANRNTVYFGFDKYSIESDDESKIAEYAKKLRENPKLKLRISGHTDITGSREYNVALGNRRAEAVKQALISEGINAHRLITVSYGKEQPASFGETEADYALNRRAVMDIEG
jgi:peptidoglycan-associated lipoprotein